MEWWCHAVTDYPVPVIWDDVVSVTESSEHCLKKQLWIMNFSIFAFCLQLCDLSLNDQLCAPASSSRMINDCVCLGLLAHSLILPVKSKKQQPATVQERRRSRRRRRSVIKFSLESNPYGLEHIFETRRIEDGNEKKGDGRLRCWSWLSRAFFFFFFL